MESIVNIGNLPMISCNSKYNFNDFRKIFNIYSPTIVISGPCSIENFDMLEKTAQFLSNNNINFLRAGLYKPRTSPYSFQGLRSDGLKQTKKIATKYNMITVAEITDVRDIEIIDRYIDIVQVGSRNMQNFDLIKEIGRWKKPVILKRGMGALLDEFLSAAEYIAHEGNFNILLCERGIRTFENNVRNMLDIASIALIKRYTSLPIIVDLSHSLGRKDIINEVANSVLAVGADGVMVEVHPTPQDALSDSSQQLNFQEAKKLFDNIRSKKFKE